MATKLAAEFSRCAALVIGADRPAPGIETEVRSALESGSVAWWLLEPGLTARQRVCRMQLLRRNSAREYARSIDEVGEDPAVAGNETVAGVEAECLAVGLGSFTAGGDSLMVRNVSGTPGGRKSSPMNSVTRVRTASTRRWRHGAGRDLAHVRPGQRDIPGPPAAPQSGRQPGGVVRRRRQRAPDDDGADGADRVAVRVDRARPCRGDQRDDRVHEQRDEPTPAVSWPARDLHAHRTGRAHAVERPGGIGTG